MKCIFTEDVLQMTSLYSVQNSSKKDCNSICPPPPKILGALKPLFSRSFHKFLFYKSFLLLPCALLFFALFLGACSGSSSSSSRSSNDSSNSSEPESNPEQSPKTNFDSNCKIENGQAELRGNKCAVIGCNAGYDNQENSRLCEKTIAGHYSPAGNNERTACPGKPNNSIWISGTVLTSVSDCTRAVWGCDAGYDNQENNHLCEKP